MARAAITPRESDTARSPRSFPGLIFLRSSISLFLRNCRDHNTSTARRPHKLLASAVPNFTHGRFEERALVFCNRRPLQAACSGKPVHRKHPSYQTRNKTSTRPESAAEDEYRPENQRSTSRVP